MFLIVLLIILINNDSDSQTLKLVKFLNANGGIYSAPASFGGFFIKSTIGQLAVEKRINSNKNDLVLYNGYWSKVGSKVQTVIELDLVPDFMKIKNTPNPFSNQTNIIYELVNTSKVDLIVYDVSGNQIAVLVNGIQEKGSHFIIFNTILPNGIVLSSGTYFYDLKVSPISFVSESYFEAYNLRNIMVIVK
ncbi:MAG: T9SS type A sorting domain-containing protein [Candidatus Kapabacteria bacterium]|nr:T9SS type A sorting domain-containing protein [Candidatus Kapabacteria bacterium]